MGILKKDFQYKIVKNFIQQREVEIGLHYILLMHKRNFNNFDQGQCKQAETVLTGDSFTDTLLMQKKGELEKLSGLQLLPTYAFSRVYNYDSVLEKHKDRPSCEVSISIMWGSDGTPWPLKMGKEEINMSPGDAVLYAGCDIEHSRNNFTGDYHVQTFLHYVDKNGPHTEWLFDKREPYDIPELQL
jgi:hypothetical protein